jgi:hypothetical protein
MPDTKNESLLFGSIAHSCIEWILKNKTKPSKKELAEKIDTLFLKEGVEETSANKKMKHECEDAVSGWVENYFDALLAEYESEQSISCRLPEYGDLNFYGKIDLLERYPDGTYRVTDFKTGKPKTGSSIEKIDDEGMLSDYMRQLAMYSFLLMYNSRQGSIHESCLLFLEAPKGDKHALYSTHIDTEKINLLKKDIATYVQSLSSGDWIHRPCNAKSYGGSTSECEYCTRAKNVFNISIK